MPHKVQVNQNNVNLPGGPEQEDLQYEAGAQVTLSDEAFGSVNQSLFSDGLGLGGSYGSNTLTDLGEISGTGGNGSVAAVTLTSAQVSLTNAVNPANASYTQADQTTEAALVNGLKTAYNALQADVAAILAALKA